ncbi:MAG: transglutaminase domain-containing protein [Bradymonadaceae bacterium]
MAQRVVGLAGKIIWIAFKVLLALLVILIPILGVWFASSIAAFWNGPIWLVVVSGLFFFPVLPLLWEWRGAAWFNKRVANTPPTREPPERILTFFDRLVLRTLAINLSLLVALGLAFPEEGFKAVSTRGDWMLDNVEGQWVDHTRDVLFATADGLEWLYAMAHDDPFDEFAETTGVVPGADERGQIETVIADTVDTKEDTPEKDEEALPEGPLTWPPPAMLHPLVVNMPPEAEESIESVAKYILENEPDPFRRVKALFDYAADRIAYDVPALSLDRIPPQHAEKVFAEKKGVCSGYALLLTALGEHTGDEIVYIVGVSRNLSGDVGGGGHAWNAARIEGNWYLLDATWAAGNVNGDTFEKAYKPVFLFTPPEVFINTHFPDEPDWQLLDMPLSRGDYMRQPVLRPDFFANAMKLKSPTRSQITVRERVDVTLENPKNRFLLANLVPRGEKEGPSCTVIQGSESKITCFLPGPGTFQVFIYGSAKLFDTYGFWGQVEVNRGS